MPTPQGFVQTTPYSADPLLRLMAEMARQKNVREIADQRMLMGSMNQLGNAFAQQQGRKDTLAEAGKEREHEVGLEATKQAGATERAELGAQVARNTRTARGMEDARSREQAWEIEQGRLRQRAEEEANRQAQRKADAARQATDAERDAEYRAGQLDVARRRVTTVEAAELRRAKSAERAATTREKRAATYAKAIENVRKAQDAQERRLARGQLLARASEAGREARSIRMSIDKMGQLGAFMPGGPARIAELQADLAEAQQHKRDLDDAFDASAKLPPFLRSLVSEMYSSGSNKSPGQMASDIVSLAQSGDLPTMQAWFRAMEAEEPGSAARVIALLATQARRDMADARR